MSKMFDYFYGNESEHYLFLKLPLALVKDDFFKDLAAESIILYTLLLNRSALSAKNGWLDEQGRVYIIYTIEEIAKDLRRCQQKAVKSIKELREIGLIESVRMGFGKPNLIYVMNYTTPLKYHKNSNEESLNPVNSENDATHHSENDATHHSENDATHHSENDATHHSENDATHHVVILKNNNIDFSYMKSESESTSVRKSASTSVRVPAISKSGNENEAGRDETGQDKTIHTEKKKIILKTKKRLPQTSRPTLPQASDSKESQQTMYDYNTYKAIIQENISYSFFEDYRRQDLQRVDELVECMLDVICGVGNTVKINSEHKKREMVINRYLQINNSDIATVLERYAEQRHRIKNISGYLKTCLYNVKNEADHAAVNEVAVCFQSEGAAMPPMVQEYDGEYVFDDACK